MSDASSDMHPGRSVRDVAVRQNAAWCDLVCRAHGRSTTWTDDVWSCSTRSPDLHPDAVTLRAEVDVVELLTSIDQSTGCSVKDSYATLDLTPFGFHVLFDATWVAARATGEGGAWRPMATAAELAAWQSSWVTAGGVMGVLDPVRLASDDVTFVGEIVGGEVRAGAALHTFEGVIGVGNTFGLEPWRHVLACVAPDATVVGYERGDDLVGALSAGASAVGRLRVWLRPASGG
jgi:hypothetical protein